MKKAMLFILTCILSLSVSVVSFAGENVIASLADDTLEAKLYNVETGETETIVLKDVTKTIENNIVGDEELTTVTARGTFYLPDEEGIKPFSSVSGDDYDNSGGVTAEMKIVYSKIYDTSLTHEEQKKLLITKVSGSWTVNDSSISLSNRKVKMVCSSVMPTVDQVKTKNPTSNTFSYRTYFDEYICVNGYTPTAGATMEATLKRGTKSSWVFMYDMLENIVGGGNYVSWQKKRKI